MPRYDFNIAKDVLSDQEKNRVLAAFLSIDSPNSVINWTLATRGFGAASEESMRVMIRTSLKKIKDAGGELAEDGSNVPANPTKKAGRKRKSAEEGGNSPEKKAKGRPKKSEPKVEVKDEDDADAAANEGYDIDADNITIKAEA